MSETSTLISLTGKITWATETDQNPFSTRFLSESPGKDRVN